jgi:hypothetical protein
MVALLVGNMIALDKSASPHIIRWKNVILSTLFGRINLKI